MGLGELLVLGERVRQARSEELGEATRGEPIAGALDRKRIGGEGLTCLQRPRGDDAAPRDCAGVQLRGLSDLVAVPEHRLGGADAPDQLPQLLRLERDGMVWARERTVEGEVALYEAGVASDRGKARIEAEAVI